MLEAEMTQHLGYDPYERSESTNARNGKKEKSFLVNMVILESSPSR